MSLKRLPLADAGLSLLFHCLKAVVALGLNWMVLHRFAVHDFVIWSVTSSVLIVATASDLGIGQYMVTRMINAPTDQWPSHIARGLSALSPLVLIAILFVFFALDGPTPVYRALMAMLLAGRIITIPFVAALHAMNQFKVRKAIELVGYLSAALAVGAIILLGGRIYVALLALNASFLLGAVLMGVAACRYVSFSKSFRIASLAGSVEVFRNAVPFMANNLTGLLTYGGFMWLSSLALPQVDVAKLAVLHSFVLINSYQLYDVFLKARQADLADPSVVPPYRTLNYLLMAALPPSFLLAGRHAVALIDHRIALGPLEVGLFGVFMALELGNLFAQSVTQVSLLLAGRLKVYAAIRSATLVGFAIAGMAPVSGDARLPLLLSMLSLGSLAAFSYLMRQLRPHLPKSGAKAEFDAHST